MKVWSAEQNQLILAEKGGDGSGGDIILTLNYCIQSVVY